jgi:catechol 2,3-dioxygenase-like lactoylglutathione lyase family enzyme
VTSSLAHINAMSLFVEDLQAAKGFYLNVFGVPVLFEDESSVAMRFENLIVNLLHVESAREIVEPGAVATRDSGSRFQLSIWVPDVDAVCIELQQRGVEVLAGRAIGRGACAPQTSSIRPATLGDRSARRSEGDMIQAVKPAPSHLRPLPNAICPLCGAPNECAPAQSGSFDEQCWCAGVAVSAASGPGVPARAQSLVSVSRCATTSEAVAPARGRRTNKVTSHGDPVAAGYSVAAGYRDRPSSSSTCSKGGSSSNTKASNVRLVAGRARSPGDSA